ncbi:hypothetical protein FRB93_008767 [Tulasnella sp. JGI-2019a]|nr:hypothetical protein FRB93_008767 [Tulasnella sp. JGI-2019a]
MEADGTLHWPFPQVTSVDLRDSSLSVDPLLRMFRARYGPTQLPDGSGNVPRSAGDSPTPLTRLVLRNITGLDLAAMEEIKRLLPDCALEVSPLLPALLQLS